MCHICYHKFLSSMSSSVEWKFQWISTLMQNVMLWTLIVIIKITVINQVDIRFLSLHLSSLCYALQRVQYNTIFDRMQLGFYQRSINISYMYYFTNSFRLLIIALHGKHPGAMNLKRKDKTRFSESHFLRNGLPICLFCNLCVGLKYIAEEIQFNLLITTKCWLNVSFEMMA